AVHAVPTSEHLDSLGWRAAGFKKSLSCRINQARRYGPGRNELHQNLPCLRECSFPEPSDDLPSSNGLCIAVFGSCCDGTLAWRRCGWAPPRSPRAALKLNRRRIILLNNFKSIKKSSFKSN